MVSIHIPSDAILTEYNCKSSLKMAKDFFEKYAAEYANVPYILPFLAFKPSTKGTSPRKLQHP